jgi:branched-chain amino acid aminotransferase
MIQSDFAWVNGKMIPFAEATTHISSFTLHYGLAVFEGIRCYRRHDGSSVVFRLREHAERLIESAKIATMDLGFSAADLEKACLETLRANKLAEAYLRPFAWVGAGALGLGSRDNPVEVAVIAFPWAAYLGEEGLRSGIRAHVSSYVRGHLNHTMSKGKIGGQYVNSVLAKREALRLGFDEGIMLDADGRVAEGTGENIFVVYRGQLHTPPLDMPILPGITRDAVITLARETGLPLVEQAFTRDMLYTASEVFLTGTASEVTPVREIDARPVGDGTPGPITRKLQELFFQIVRGPADRHREWLTPV